MRILLLGPHGQLGQALRPALAPFGEVVALGREADPATPELSGDLENPAALELTLQCVQPDLIVNAAAWTAVDHAEHDATRAHAVNAGAPALLAAEAARRGTLLVHYSTDYVFDGRAPRPHVENDPTGPLNVYGASKLAGEEAIRASGCRHFIFRTSWVYSGSGRNFLTRILELAHEREQLEVVDDQIGAPTSARRIAEVTARVLTHALLANANPARSGLYHLAASGEISWHGYAQAIVRLAHTLGLELRLSADTIHPVSSAHRPGARRPASSRLDTSRLQRDFGIWLPHWHDDLAAEMVRLARPHQDEPRP